jgi:phosphoglycolate phosphatase
LGQFAKEEDFELREHSIKVRFKMIEHVIWDWNGTLIDDAQLCVSIVNEILSGNMLSEVSLNYYRENFCFPVREYYEKIGLSCEGASYHELSEKFISEYRKRWKTCELQTNALTVISSLNQAGIGQSILSASKSTDLKLFLEGFGLEKYIDLASGVCDVLASGKVEISKRHLNDIGVEPDEVLLVGDTKHDEEISKHLSTDCILFTGGHNSANALRRCDSELTDDLRQVMARVLG